MAHGYPSQYLTVRPTGHPFQRKVSLPPIENTLWGLVVDECPGQSGSSMAAVAEAMTQAGISSDHIGFLPGHNLDPGNAASSDIRRWWASVPRYVSDAETVGVKKWLGQATARYFKSSLAEKVCPMIFTGSA